LFSDLIDVVVGWWINHDTTQDTESQIVWHVREGADLKTRFHISLPMETSEEQVKKSIAAYIKVWDMGVDRGRCLGRKDKAREVRTVLGIRR